MLLVRMGFGSQAVRRFAIVAIRAREKQVFAVGQLSDCTATLRPRKYPTFRQHVDGPR